MHPQRTARLIDNLETELADERKKHRTAVHQARQHADTLRQEAANARGETSRVLEQLNALQKKHDALRQQFETEIQQHATLFTDRQNDIDELKAGYERRLEHLRHALADAHALLADRNDYDALRQMTLIDMTQGNTTPAPSSTPAPAVREAQPKHSTTSSRAQSSKSTDWLEPLPD